MSDVLFGGDFYVYVGYINVASRVFVFHYYYILPLFHAMKKPRC
jgi:hypothetical protein